MPRAVTREFNVPYCEHTLYETILLQYFGDVSHFTTSEAYKDLNSKKQKKEWPVLEGGVPYYMQTSFETILLQRFGDTSHFTTSEAYKVLISNK